MFSNKKGNIGSLFPAILALVLVGILLGVGLMILSQFQLTATGTANTAIGSVITSLGTLASTWIPIIVIVVAAALVIGILLGGFGGKKM